MDTDMTIDTEFILWHNRTIEIPKWLLDKYRSRSIQIDDQYLDTIYREKDVPMFSFQLEPRYSQEMTFLLRCNWNKICAKEHLGRFVLYDHFGRKACYFDNLIEIVLDEKNRHAPLGFEELDKIMVYPDKVAKIRQKAGLEINQGNLKGNLMLKMLNDYARDMFAWYYGVRAEKQFDDPCRAFLHQHYTLDEFKKQRTLASSARFYDSLLSVLVADGKWKKERLDRKNLPEAEYKEALSKLFKRYTIKGHLLFQRVDSLEKYRNFTGIYVLCLNEARGYYIGQAKTSLYKRITQHWKHPNSAFDTKYSKSDVTEIYVIPFASRYSFDYDIIEQDCIASIPKQYLLNALASSLVFMTVSNKDYAQNNFLIPTKELYRIKQKLLRQQV